MNSDKLGQALNSISDRHLAEAARDRIAAGDGLLSEQYLAEATTPRRRWVSVLASAAAVLAIVVSMSLLLPGRELAPMEEPGESISDTPIQLDPAPPAVSPLVSEQKPGNVELLGLVSAPEYPDMALYPQDQRDSEQQDLWYASQREQYDQPSGYAQSLESFWLRSLPVLLGNDGKNAACSPVNIYSALAMLAECTEGSSRAQILELLGADSLEALRRQAGYVWNAHYCFDGATTSVLGSSLWLDDTLSFDPDTAATLSDSYYASVFQGDLGSDAMNTALRDWLNDMTGGLLKEQVQNQKMDTNTALGLATTIFYRSSWMHGFSAANSTYRTFHGTGGDRETTFMNTTFTYGTYYSGPDYGAVSLPLQDGSRMWLILPAEGKTPADVLSSGNAAAMILAGEGISRKEITIHLSVPRFDVSAQTDLVPVLQQLGITDAFDSTAADFSAIAPGRNDLYLGKADHAARVAIDEEGVVAAAYTVMYVYATGVFQPPVEQMEFILDRPFLFLVESEDGLPTFAGVVNDPSVSVSEAPREDAVPQETQSLSEEALADFARLFAVTTDDQDIAHIPYYNTALLTTFDSPENVDLAVLFGNGTGDGSALTQDEVAFLQAQGADMALDIHRIRISEADTVLRALFGIGWADTAQVGLERLYHSQALDCCYRAAGGVTVAENVKFHSGIRQGDLIRLYYTIGGGETRKLTLRETGEGLLILSNTVCLNPEP